jgi:hypothetical protein
MLSRSRNNFGRWAAILPDTTCRNSGSIPRRTAISTYSPTLLAVVSDSHHRRGMPASHHPTKLHDGGIFHTSDPSAELQPDHSIASRNTSAGNGRETAVIHFWQKDAVLLGRKVMARESRLQPALKNRRYRRTIAVTDEHKAAASDALGNLWEDIVVLGKILDQVLTAPIHHFVWSNTDICSSQSEMRGVRRGVVDRQIRQPDQALGIVLWLIPLYQVHQHIGVAGEI